MVKEDVKSMVAAKRNGCDSTKVNGKNFKNNNSGEFGAAWSIGTKFT